MNEGANQNGPGTTLEARRYPLGEALGRMWPVVRPHRWRLLLGCGMIAVAGGIFGLMPLFARALIDEAIPRQSLGLAALIAGGFLLTHGLRMTVWFVAMRQILLMQEKITFALRTLGFAQLQRLSLSFHHRFPSGYLYQSIFGTAIGAVGGAMQTVFKQLSLYVVALGTSLAACLMISPPMTLLLLAGSVGYIVMGRLTAPRIYRTTQLSLQSQNEISEFVVDRLRGMRTTQAMAMEACIEDEFTQLLWPAQLRSLEAMKQTFRLSVMTEWAGYVVGALIMVVGAYAMFRWGLSLGDLVAFMAYQATFITVVSTLTNVWGSLTAARAGLDQLLTVLDTHSEVPERPDAHMPTVVEGRLSFEAVDFCYRPQSPVLQGLNLTFPPGQNVALVGPSGGGKTTLTNLLLRFHDPEQGRISLDGHDIRDLPIKPYRALFGVVLQDPYLFNTSIAANLRYAAPEANEEQLIEALRLARAWSFVEQLPGRLDYVVGEGGSQLSGGQRQRIAIARCLLLRSRFVILDEPTSALDVEAEKAVQDAFESLFVNRTTFIIAHRLSTIRHADRILVLQDGRVVQDGTYDQLTSTPGLFQQMQRLAGAAPDP